MINKNFFQALFDFSFDHFITTKIIKFLFILGIAGSIIYGIIVLWAGIQLVKASTILGILLCLSAPLVSLLITILIRVWLEIIITNFKIAENTSLLVENEKNKNQVL